MNSKREPDRPTIAWTAEDRARHRAIREQFDRERPSLDALRASGEYSEAVPHGEYLALQVAIQELKRERERRGLSLAQVSESSGLDPAAISRLETGRNPNPTVETLRRYAAALGKQLSWVVSDLPASSAP